ncbi:MAG: tetratricopeptide repeat protein, partial [Gammaproteobacteria bacterium]|nr:tetratricopeptide repeat protein [Gammaproteobacteria bacterium]
MESRLDDKILLKMSLDALQQNQMANAIWFMQQAAEIAPEIILYKRNLGELLRRAGQLEAAISSLKIAISMEPHCAENYFLLGLAYNDNRQFELAIHYYHIAISYEYNYVMAWNNLGASLESMNDRKNAKVAYTTAIALNPKHAEAQNNLGAIYSEENQLDKAHTHFTAAITANPAFIDAHYNLSLIKTYTPNDPHLNFLESINQKIDHYPHLTRIRYYFTLGKALDDTKQYTPAFKAYAEGNRLHYLKNPWNKIKLQVFTQSVIQTFTPSFLKKSRIIKNTCFPIFIVGMPRAGTTLIEQILSS